MFKCAGNLYAPGGGGELGTGGISHGPQKPRSTVSWKEALLPLEEKEQGRPLVEETQLGRGP